MKKRYSGYNKIFAFFTCTFFTVACIVIIVGSCIVFLVDPFVSIMGVGIGLASLIWSCHSLLRRMAARLTIVDDKLFILRAPFQRTIKMDVEDCAYVGVQDSSALGNNNSPAKIVEQYGRGDMYSYIYLSTHPYPDKYIHKAEIAPCKKGFIKIKYSDEICLALMQILPPNKTAQLRSFYNLMQSNDRLDEIRRQNRKKKREKEKQKKKEKKIRAKNDKG